MGMPSEIKVWPTFGWNDESCFALLHWEETEKSLSWRPVIVIIIIICSVEHPWLPLQNSFHGFDGWIPILTPTAICKISIFKPDSSHNFIFYFSRSFCSYSAPLTVCGKVPCLDLWPWTLGPGPYILQSLHPWSCGSSPRTLIGWGIWLASLKLSPKKGCLPNTCNNFNLQGSTIGK